MSAGWSSVSLKVTGWGIMFICGMALRCAGNLKSCLESGPVTADLTTTTVVHSYKLLVTTWNPFTHSFKPFLENWCICFCRMDTYFTFKSVRWGKYLYYDR